jgi:hypothetical protein
MLRVRCTGGLDLQAPTGDKVWTMPALTATEEYRDLLAAQRRLSHCIADPQTPAKEIAACARVLASVIDQKRVMRMKPKPKDIDTTKQPSRRRVAQRNDPERPIFRLAQPDPKESLSSPTVTAPPTQEGGAVS